MNKNTVWNIVSVVISFSIVIASVLFVYHHFNSKQEAVLLENDALRQTTVHLEKEKTNVEDNTAKNDEKISRGNEKTTKTKVIKKDNLSFEEKAEQKGKETSTKLASENTPATMEAAKKEAGTLGFLWDAVDQVFYSAKDPWQRVWGYNQFYDWAAQFIVLYYDTVRIKFNYGGYDWLVQLWKGQYGFVLIGAEVGVYYKEEGSTIEHYVCSDNEMRLKVGYSCYDKGSIIFTRRYQDTWWLTGFVPGKLEKFNDRSEIEMQIRITAKSYEMAKKMCDGIEKSGFKHTNKAFSIPDTYHISGNDIYIYCKNISEM